MQRLPEPDKVQAARKVMEQHYNEPVRPVTHYCNALRDYLKALRQLRDENPEDPQAYGNNNGPWGTREQLDSVIEGLTLLDHMAYKSNLLWRLIYADMPLRTEKCPRHHGTWSGCHYSDTPLETAIEGMGEGYCECQVGYDVTGWLPLPTERPKSQD